MGSFTSFHLTIHSPNRTSTVPFKKQKSRIESTTSSKMSKVNSLPWKDGYYKMTDNNNCLFLVNGETVNVEKLTGEHELGKDSWGTWKFGDFGEASPEVKE